jgi:cell fate regulator YaaT (PSP1 superfamily)
MAKKQELSLNVNKLSGLCGRLMCCLRYEYDGDMEEITTDDDIPQEDESLLEKEQTIVNVISTLEQQERDESEIHKGERQERFRSKRRRFRK